MKKVGDLETRLKADTDNRVFDFPRPLGVAGVLLEPSSETEEQETGVEENRIDFLLSDPDDPVISAYETLLDVISEGGHKRLGLDAASFRNVLESHSYVEVNDIEKNDSDVGFYPIYQELDKNAPRKLKLRTQFHTIEIEYCNSGVYIAAFYPIRFGSNRIDKQEAKKYLRAYADAVYRLSELVGNDIKSPVLRKTLENLSGSRECLVQVAFTEGKTSIIIRDGQEVISKLAPQVRKNKYFEAVANAYSIIMTKDHEQSKLSTGTEGKK